MKGLLRCSVWLAVLACSTIAGERHILVTVKGSLTSNTRILYNINTYNPFDPGKNIASNLGFGADLRGNILWDRFYIGAGFEKVQAKETFQLYYPQYPSLQVPSEEGFSINIIELSGYYIVPISSENLQFYLGGGFGAYSGNRSYSIAGIHAATLNNISSVGIHVLTGIEYYVFNFLALRAELKFRDPHFDVTNKFEQPFTEFDQRQIPLSQTESVTRINLYGINYAAGIVIAL